MADTINYGIDLGTTNSAIAKFVKGNVEIFKSPTDWTDTIPSVVAFKKDKILVGRKAKDLFEKSPQNAVGVFKRKMGTSETYKIKSTKQSISPVELSAFVLKELKTFVPQQEELQAAVITIPASFDTIQSNATKTAGNEAGFKQVILLQEPIAASLAYANKHKEVKLDEGKWLVYDLGGGTFDVALVSNQDGELRVLDHEGDNFLGGSDFDRFIVEKLVVPRLEQKYSFNNLLLDLQSASGKYNGVYYNLLGKAEEAKIQLSAKTSAEIEVIMEDDEGSVIDEEFTITRSEFIDIIKDSIESSITLVKKIMVRNNLKPEDLKFTLMVGGSTYIPYVRSRVAEVLQVAVNCEIDPTTAVAIGAAFFAGTKQLKLTEDAVKKKQYSLKIKAVYQKASRDKEELFSAKVLGDFSSLNYRIMRSDGGFDTGMKPLREKLMEDLPLVEDAYNFFRFTVYDHQNNIIDTGVEDIEIAQGKFSIAGQPIPNDISIVVDDIDNQGTRLEKFFSKNSILPLRNKIIKTINKTVAKGSNESIVINVVEGPADMPVESNQTIGFIKISGSDVSRDIIKGSDIELSIEISESRDLHVSAYLSMSDQEFTVAFDAQERHVTIEWLQDEIYDLEEKLQQEISESVEREDYETAKELEKVKTRFKIVRDQADTMSDDDITDKKFQLENEKRNTAKAIYDLTRDKKIKQLLVAYQEQKSETAEMVADNGNDNERRQLFDITSDERVFLNSSSPTLLQTKIDQLNSLFWAVKWRTPEFLTGSFRYFENNTNRLNDQEQAQSLLESGRFAIDGKNWNRLREIVGGLYNLMPADRDRRDMQTRIGFN